jgi:hypothetical protein
MAIYGVIDWDIFLYAFSLGCFNNYLFISINSMNYKWDVI